MALVSESGTPGDGAGRPAGPRDPRRRVPLELSNGVPPMPRSAPRAEMISEPGGAPLAPGDDGRPVLGPPAGRPGQD